LASKYGHKEVVKLLKKHGAKLPDWQVGNEWYTLFMGWGERKWLWKREKVDKGETLLSIEKGMLRRWWDSY
jgi:hypothetical protein